MTKLIVCHPDLYKSDKDSILLNSFNPDVLSIQYTHGMTREQFIEAVQQSHKLSEFSQIAFLYHYPGYNTLPFFNDADLIDASRDNEIEEYDIDSNDSLELIQPPQPIQPIQSKYRYFSNNVIDIIKLLKDAYTGSGQFIVDILSCDLNSKSYADEVAIIETELNVDIRYSTDKTGNPTSGANWVLESDNINVREVYFTEDVLGWSGVLDDNIAGIIKNDNNLNEFIRFNADTNTYTVQKNFVWSELITVNNTITNTSFIQLEVGETFDGNNYSINLDTITEWQGLLTSAGNDPNSTIPLIKNLGILNGTTSFLGGFIIRGNQQFINIDNCYSTGTIGSAGGGISGFGAGFSGSCTITNCHSTGAILNSAGGIVGQSAGSSGSCTITNCHSTGAIGASGGGVAGQFAGSSGSCTITNCYSTGAISSGGGIAGSSAGSSGSCTITNCYSTGAIGNFGGGIAGQFAGINSGFCTILDCYSTGAINGNGVGGITGSFAGVVGSCTITNCHSTGHINGNGVGGIAGQQCGERGVCAVTNCFSIGDMNGNFSGGIVGFLCGRGGVCNITRCYSTGNMNGTNTGGIASASAGRNLSLTISGTLVKFPGNCIINECYSLGDINATAINAGGIAGSSSGVNNVLVGNEETHFSRCEINNCYSIGNVNATTAGGIVGFGAASSLIGGGNCIVTNCYSIGFGVTGAGGIVAMDAGLNGGNCTIVGCISRLKTFSSTNGVVTSTNNTMIVDNLLKVFDSPRNWSASIWALGESVTIVGKPSLTLPILLKFTIAPWNVGMYTKATDPAQFSTVFDSIPDFIGFEGDTYIRLSWNPSFQTGKFNLASYTLQIFENTTNTLVNSYVLDSTVDSYVVDNLTNDTIYNFSIQATNTNNESNTPSVITATPKLLSVDAITNQYASNSNAYFDYLNYGSASLLPIEDNFIAIRGSLKTNTTLSRTDKSNAVLSYITAFQTKYNTSSFIIQDSTAIRLFGNSYISKTTMYDDKNKIIVTLPSFTSTFNTLIMASEQIVIPAADEYYHYEVPENAAIQLKSGNSYVTLYNSSFRYVLIDSRNSPDQLNTVYNAGSIVNVSSAVSLRLYGIGSLLVGEPRYNPKCCPTPPNRDPRRFETYCLPPKSLSEPLSHTEYVRQKKASNTAPLSSPANLLQIGTGSGYVRTIWSASNNACCTTPSPPVPAVMPKTHARPESLRITNVGAAAGRGTISKYDSINRDASNTTLRQHGQTIANEKCTSCSLLTGTEIYPGRGFCKCVSE